MGLLSRTFTSDLVDFVIDEAGAREERTKSLPARLMVYFVLTMWLFTGSGYGLVLRELVEHWPRRAGEGWRPARTGSLTEARQRLGPGPLRLLFDRVAGVSGSAATPGAFWRGLRLTSLDGSLFDVPASEANAAAYGRSVNGHGPGPFPQVRLLALVECGTKAMIGAVFDSFAVGERTLAHRLLVHLRGGMLLMADRGFPAFDLWQAAAQTRAQLLWRCSDSFTLPVDRILHDGTYLSHLNGPRGKRTTVRVVEYTVTTSTPDESGVSEETSELFCLITTLLEPQTAPAAELAELYTSRWTSETIFKHIKIEQRGGRTATLRSNSPAMVEQELWAMLCVYQAIHHLTVETAGDAQLPVSHISFKQTLAAARRSVGVDFSPSPTGRQGS